MKNRWLFGVLALIAVTLACSIFPSLRARTNVTSIAVTPLSGEKDFNLEIKYNYTWDPKKPNEDIDCTYRSPSGEAALIHTFVPAGSDKDKKTVFKDETLAFSIKPIGGKIEPGIYVANCRTDLQKEPVTAAFTVIESAASANVPNPGYTEPPKPASTEPPKPAATEPPAPVATQPPAPAPVSGKIVFDYASVDSSRKGAGGELARVTNLCMPEVTFSPEGNISGACEKLHIQALLTDESITVQVSGKVDPTGNITFSYDVSEIGNPNGAWRISYEGQGKLTTASQASGTAAFSYSCSSGADNLFWCWKWTSESFSGTIPWSFGPVQ